MRTIEKVARAIATEITPSYETLYANKQAWNADSGRRHDINTPFKSDIDDAARAAIEALIIRTDQMGRADEYVANDAWNSRLCAILDEQPAAYKKNEPDGG